MKQTEDKMQPAPPGVRNAQNGASAGKRFRMGGILLIIFLAIYIPSFLHWTSGKNIRTDVLRIGNLEESVSAEGIVIRDEEVLKAGFSGKLIPDLEDGERAAAGARVATVLKKDSMDLLKRLNEKNLKIIEEQQKKGDNLGLFSEDINKIEEMIDQKAAKLAQLSNKNSLDPVSGLKSEIDALIEKRASVYGSMGTADAYINTLKQERDAIRNQLDTNTESIVTKASGIISYSVDGYEDALNPSAIKQLTPGLLSDIKNKKPAEITGEIDIASGRPFAKVIRGIEFYIAVPVDEKDAGMFKAGDIITVRINDIGEQTGDAVIAYISEPEAGKRVIAVKLNRFLSETSSMRRVSIDLVKNSLEGLKAPVSSLLNTDFQKGEADIMLVKYNSAVKARVKILLRNTEYAIIANPEETDGRVSLYSIYVVDPENIEEGQIIEQ